LTIALGTRFVKNVDKTNLSTKFENKSLNFHDLYERKHKDNLGEGGSSSKLPIRKETLSSFSIFQNFGLEDIFSEYSLSRKYFQKNLKNTLKSLEEMNSSSNL
jgi:hypothetical protein